MKIFITGLSSGIGKESSKQLVAAGHEVWGVARRYHLLEKLSEEVNSDLFHFDQCDINNRSEVRDVCQRMQAKHFLPDVVILNAAIDREDIYPYFSEVLTHEIFRTNLEGALVWVSAFIEPFLNRGSGQFIAISSLFANWPDKSCVAYSASKAGLSMAFRGLRLRYSKSMLSFKILYLGPVNTQINPRFKDNPHDKKSFIISHPEDVARYLTKIIHNRRLDFYYPFYINIIFKPVFYCLVA